MTLFWLDVPSHPNSGVSPGDYLRVTVQLHWTLKVSFSDCVEMIGSQNEADSSPATVSS